MVLPTINIVIYLKKKLYSLKRITFKFDYILLNQ